MPCPLFERYSFKDVQQVQAANEPLRMVVVADTSTTADANSCVARCHNHAKEKWNRQPGQGLHATQEFQRGATRRTVQRAVSIRLRSVVQCGGHVCFLRLELVKRGRILGHVAQLNLTAHRQRPADGLLDAQGKLVVYQRHRHLLGTSFVKARNRQDDVTHWVVARKPVPVPHFNAHLVVKVVQRNRILGVPHGVQRSLDTTRLPLVAAHLDDTVRVRGAAHVHRLQIFCTHNSEVE
mmetsp:Transcript_15751/g.49310  ORF Transcript_15751/g.49310 Transcript_15751/m.49310 type:complete len:237 (+) Transcript_15751:3299-4009(+)